MRPTIQKSRKRPEFPCNYPGIPTLGSSCRGVGWRAGFTGSLCMAKVESGRCRFSLRAERELGDRHCGWDRIPKLLCCSSSKTAREDVNTLYTATAGVTNYFLSLVPVLQSRRVRPAITTWE